ncbi:MAG TPA: EAL domain-containing protein, partial [Sulfuricurvum sp.]|nr:EAL domain-containing protein [Sulfuricurvum sp.]
EAIIVFANTMNFTLIAEGIETEEQERFLLEKGCELGQGYLFSKPIEIEALIRHFS